MQTLHAKTQHELFLFWQVLDFSISSQKKKKRRRTFLTAIDALFLAIELSLSLIKDHTRFSTYCRISAHVCCDLRAFLIQTKLLLTLFSPRRRNRDFDTLSDICIANKVKLGRYNQIGRRYQYYFPFSLRRVCWCIDRKLRQEASRCRNISTPHANASGFALSVWNIATNYQCTLL